MHHYSFLYVKFHKVHHEYKYSTLLAAHHVHPVDDLLTIALPVSIALAIIKPHSFTQFQWMLYIAYTNLDDHAGYAFPFSPVRWLPFAASSEEHSFHHFINVGSFSKKLTIFEDIFGTRERFLSYKKQKKI